MDDELEDKVIYQTFITHMKFFSRIAVGLPSVSQFFGYFWRLIRLYLLKPEILLCGLVLVLVFAYLHAVETWNYGILGRLQSTLSSLRPTAKISKLQMMKPNAENESWEIIKERAAVYAVQGRRPKMEDRFIVEENINSSGIALYAIFDGHGGEFAADFARDILIPNLLNKIIETTNELNGKTKTTSDCDKNSDNDDPDERPSKTIEKNNNELIHRLSQRKNNKKTYSLTEDCLNKTNCKNTPEEDFMILNKLSSPLGKDNIFGINSDKNKKTPPKSLMGKCYIENGKINFGKILTDEVLAADYKLVEQAKKTLNVAGTTALMAVMHGTILTVANVGDSRGVMCDFKGHAIPLSFDHKPQLSRERKRIQEAGGFIAFKGVWRVAGILATSRALGDYPLKENNFVIADPDILTFELSDHKPIFLILASDGLWDAFSNEEAVLYIKDHITEPHFGAKSLTLQAYYRGSVDNITVLVIVFKDGAYKIGSSAAA